MKNILQMLGQEKRTAKQRLDAIEKAIEVLSNGTRRGERHRMSADARRRISLAQKKRWAAKRAGKR